MSERNATPLPWLFLQRMQHRSTSLNTMSSLEGSATSSATLRSILRPCHASSPLFLGAGADGPSFLRAQKSTRSAGFSRNLSRRAAKSLLLRPAREPGCAAGTASSSSSLSSISTCTGPSAFSAGSTGSPTAADSSVAGGAACSERRLGTCFSSSSAALVFSRRSLASRSRGKSRSASSRSSTASCQRCRARSAAARRTKALKQASALFRKPSSKISEYSMTLLHEAMASCQRKTFVSAKALLVQSALSSRLYSKPSS
mmetsp:Transcript_107237/g.218831  ORF Transcript_107237/g.218831 Transcript_107237/m.218831 type:complete len:258 (+) Transcript_107237:1775-2548(+)